MGPILPTCVGGTCTYRFCWCFQRGFFERRLLLFQLVQVMFVSLEAARLDNSGGAFASRACWSRGRWLVRDSMMGLVGLGGGVGLVGYRVWWLAVVVESPACRTLACWPSAGTEMGGGGHEMWPGSYGLRIGSVYLGYQSLTSSFNWYRWYLCL